MGTGSFPGVKCGRAVLLTTYPLLVPRSWKSRAIPLPTLWATPGLQRDHFTFFVLKNITNNTHNFPSNQFGFMFMKSGRNSPDKTPVEQNLDWANPSRAASCDGSTTVKSCTRFEFKWPRLWNVVNEFNGIVDIVNTVYNLRLRKIPQLSGGWICHRLYGKT